MKYLRMFAALSPALLMSVLSLDAQVPAELPGWPIVLPGFADSWHSPAIVDVDGDGQLEVICGSESPGRMNVMRADGSTMAGWPFDYTGRQWSPAVVGDIDGNGTQEIIWLGSNQNLKLYALSVAGVPLAGFPVPLYDRLGAKYLILADLDGDGDDEIVFGTNWDGPSQFVPRVHAYGELGVPHPGFPITLDLTPWMTDPDSTAGSAPLSAGDLDGDGADELVIGSNFSNPVTWPDGVLFLMDGEGSILPGWPQEVPGNPGSLECSLLVDEDGDTQLEVITHAHATLRRWEVDGANYNFQSPQTCSQDDNTVVADLEGDGVIELVSSGCDVVIFRDGPGIVWDATNIPVDGDVVQTRVADIDGDGMAEIVAVSDLGSDLTLHLLQADAGGTYQPVAGWPIYYDWSGKPYPCFGDLDADGDLELVYAEKHHLHALDFPAGVGPPRLEWPVHEGGLKRKSLYRDGQHVPSRFVRGDATGEGAVSIADPIAILAELFQGVDSSYACPASRDVFGDGAVDLADPIALLGYLFLAGPSPISPFPACGQQPPGEALGCGTIICP